MDSLEVQAFFY